MRSSNHLSVLSWLGLLAAFEAQLSCSHRLCWCREGQRALLAAAAPVL